MKDSGIKNKTSKHHHHLPLIVFLCITSRNMVRPSQAPRINYDALPPALPRAADATDSQPQRQFVVRRSLGPVGPSNSSEFSVLENIFQVELFTLHILLQRRIYLNDEISEVLGQIVSSLSNVMFK